MSYMILHIPTATYLYRRTIRKQKIFAIAEFSSIKQAQEVLAASLQDWSATTLYFQTEVALLTHTEDDNQLSNIWRDTYIREEFEIIKKD